MVNAKSSVLGFAYTTRKAYLSIKLYHRMRFINPRTDFAFKLIFGSEGDRRFLGQEF